MPLYPGGGTQTIGSSAVNTSSQIVISGDIPYILTPDGYKQPDFRINYRGANNAAVANGAVLPVVSGVANKRYILAAFCVASTIAGEYIWRQTDDTDAIAFKLVANSPFYISFLPHCCFPNADNQGYEVLNNSGAVANMTAFLLGWLYDTTNGDFEEM